MPATRKRPAKFGHLKVGDEVVIQVDESGKRRIATVTSIDNYRSRFKTDEYGAWYRFQTGTGIKSKYHRGGDRAVILSDAEIQSLRDKAERYELASGLRGGYGTPENKWHLLTLPQLRRIRDELDAATKGATGA